MLGIAVAFAVGALVAVLVGFFIWRNNKEKVMEQMTRLDGWVEKYDSADELKSKLEECRMNNHYEKESIEDNPRLEEAL